MYGTAVVSYLGMVFPAITPYSKIIGVLVVTLFFASTIKGSKFVSILNNIMTVVLLCAITLFVLFGLPNVKETLI